MPSPTGGRLTQSANGCGTRPDERRYLPDPQNLAQRLANEVQIHRRINHFAR